jgi:hypothetical protein
MDFKWNLRFVADLFSTPQCLVPLTLGAVVVLSGWAISTTTVIGLGFAIMGIGTALGLTRLINDREALVKGFLARERQEKIALDEARLVALAEQLKNFPGKEIRQCLRDLRALKLSFEESIAQQDIANFIDEDFRNKFTSLFWKSIDMMDKAVRLQKTAANMTNKDGIYAARDKIIGEVEENTVALRQSFEGLTVLALTHDEGALDNLRQDLDSKLSVATEVENELRGIGKSVVDEGMKEYL